MTGVLTMPKVELGPATLDSALQAEQIIELSQEVIDRFPQAGIALDYQSDRQGIRPATSVLALKDERTGAETFIATQRRGDHATSIASACLTTTLFSDSSNHFWGRELVVLARRNLYTDENGNEIQLQHPRPLQVIQSEGLTAVPPKFSLTLGRIVSSRLAGYEAEGLVQVSLNRTAEIARSHGYRID